MTQSLRKAAPEKFKMLSKSSSSAHPSGSVRLSSGGAKVAQHCAKVNQSDVVRPLSCASSLVAPRWAQEWTKIIPKHASALSLEPEWTVFVPR